MARKLLSAAEIGELIYVLRLLFKYRKDLQESSEVAKYIQRPKIPPFLSESLVVDLGNRGLLENLECSGFDLSTSNGDVVAASISGQVKIEVKATAQSAFQLFSSKDIDADFLIWVHFSDYFDNDSKDEVEIFILQEPKRFFEQSRKITLPVFKRVCGESIGRTSVSLSYYVTESRV